MRGLTVALMLLGGWAVADDRDVSLSDGAITLRAPEAWKKQQPRTRIVEYEFSAPKAKDDPADGRVTIMGAGGSVDQNVERWISQFSQPDGKASADRAKVKKSNVGTQEVTVVDLSGNYKDQAGPFAPAVVRENYRMLGAIIATPKAGQYFVKFYGPKETISSHEKAFHDMINTLKVK